MGMAGTPTAKTQTAQELLGERHFNLAAPLATRIFNDNIGPASCWAANHTAIGTLCPTARTLRIIATRYGGELGYFQYTHYIS